MKKMMIWASALMIALVVASCGKYEEGPKISLRSKKARLANEWVVTKYDVEEYEDGVLVDSYTENESSDPTIIKIDKDGTFEVDGEKGTWEFKGDTDLVFKYDDEPDYEDVFEIIRLKNKELILKFIDEYDYDDVLYKDIIKIYLEER